MKTNFVNATIGLILIIVLQTHPALAADMLSQAGYSKPATTQQQENTLLIHMSKLYTAVGDNQSAAMCLKQNIRLNPNDAESHWLLGKYYFQAGYRTPAIMAFCRFLTLEPISHRAHIASQILSGLLNIQDSFEFGNKPPDWAMIAEIKETTMSDGDFSLVKIGVYFKKALLPPEQYESQRQAIAIELELLFQVLAEMPAPVKSEGFAWQYYAPYFTAAFEDNQLGTLVHHILSSMSPPEELTWSDIHEVELSAFKQWSENYLWSMSWEQQAQSQGAGR